MRKTCLLILSAAIASAVMLQAAEACRCAGPATPRSSYGKADAVVLGAVASVSGDFEAEGGALVTLDVSRAWKSKVGSAIRIETRSTCAYDFRKGEIYLAYLTRSHGAAPFSTTICAGNHARRESKAALAWLERHGKETARTRP